MKAFLLIPLLLAPAMLPAQVAGGVGGGVGRGPKGRISSRENGAAERYYQRAMRSLDQRQWDQAIEGFSEAAKLGGPRADGALYWKAYAQNKRGQRDEALATLAELRKSFPASKWLNDAKALEVEIGRPVSPENEADEDLKLLAINSLVQSDPERAVPLLEKILKGSYTPRLKERALFVLNQSGSPKARDVVVQIARGDSNPDLQMKALHYLGIMGGKESRQALADIYASSNDLSVKRQILHSFMVAGEKDRLLAAAKDEKIPELRKEAIHQLGVLGAQTELWQLYGTESSVDVRQQILQAMFIANNSEKILEVARGDKEPTLRRDAIRKLGQMGSERSGDALVALYSKEQDEKVRREVVNSLFIQNNVKALIEIARKETNPALKKEAVQRLAIMKSKEATDFMLEILNK